MYSPAWDPYCPSGGDFYACGNGTTFVGCCQYTNPCVEAGGCSAGNLRATSFPVDKYGTFADQQCSAGKFYTCTGTTPDAFWGCCTINPCANNGCPSENLAAAFLSNNPQSADDMDPYPPVNSPSSSSSASSLSTTASTSSSASAPAASETSAVASPTATADSKSVSVGAIAGGAAGGFAVLCAIIAIIWLVRHHARKSSEKHNNESRINTAPEFTGTYGNNRNKAAMAEVTAMGSPYKDSPSVPPYSTHTSPAPHYQSGGWPNQPIQQEYAQGYPVHEAEARSHFKSYSPNETQGGNYSPYEPPHGQFSPSLSQTSDPMQSATWTNNSMGIPPRAPVPSQYSNQGFARVHQGPPQELGGDSYATNVPSNVGLGVHHIGNGDSYAPEPQRVELDARTGSPPPSKP